jgi:hypothetical protein
MSDGLRDVGPSCYEKHAFAYTGALTCSLLRKPSGLQLFERETVTPKENKCCKNLEVAMRWMWVLAAVAAAVQPTWSRLYYLQPVNVGGQEHLANAGLDLQADASLFPGRESATDNPALSSAVRSLSNKDPSQIQDNTSLQMQPGALPEPQEPAGLGDVTALPSQPPVPGPDPGGRSPFALFIFLVSSINRECTFEPTCITASLFTR